MTYPKTKIEIVKLLLDQTKEDPDFPWKDYPEDKIIFDWFVTGRAGQGLRLTDAGMVAFDRAKIAHYDFDFDIATTHTTPAWAKFTLILDKKIQCPYFVGVRIASSGKKQPYVRLYDHKIAMMMTLYGDFHEYLKSVK